MKLTANEIAVLKAIDNSEYGDNLHDEIWTFSVADNCSLKPRSLPGIVSSLSKKKLVSCCGAYDGDDATIGMTDAGIAAYVAAVGADNVKKIV